MNLRAWFPEHALRKTIALFISFTKLRVSACDWIAPHATDTIEAMAIARLGAMSASPSDPGVGRMVHRLASLAACGPEQADLLQASMPLCNIGRVAVPDAILNRTGSLDVQERLTLQAHPRIAARLLAGNASPLFTLAAEVALCQHESWDGSGYPAGLAGEQIPQGARIVAIADSFDACLSASLRGPGWLLGRAIEHMRHEAGTRFDPTLTRLFLDDLPTMLILRNGPVAPQPAQPNPAPGRAGRRRDRSQRPAALVPRLQLGLAHRLGLRVLQRLRIGVRAVERPA